MTRRHTTANVFLLSGWQSFGSGVSVPALPDLSGREGSRGGKRKKGGEQRDRVAGRVGENRDGRVNSIGDRVERIIRALTRWDREEGQQLNYIGPGVTKLNLTTPRMNAVLTNEHGAQERIQTPV